MNEINIEILVANIDSLAKKANVSRNKALIESGAGKDFVTNITQKGQIPSVTKIVQLAKYFGVSVDYLLGLEEEKSGKSENEQKGTTIYNENGYIDCYVAFLDILGFKEFVNRSEFTDVHGLYESISNVIENAASHSKSKYLKYDVLKNIRFHVISDTIVIYIPKHEKYSLYALIFLTNTMISNLLLYKPILIRGGISAGRFYDDGKFLFGSALNNAATLENKAIYPRILIDKDVYDNYKRDFRMREDRAVYEDLEEKQGKFVISDPFVKDSNFYILNYINYFLTRICYIHEKTNVENIISVFSSQIINTISDSSDDKIVKKNVYFAKMYNRELDNVKNYVTTLSSFKSSEKEENIKFFNNKEIPIVDKLNDIDLSNIESETTLKEKGAIPSPVVYKSGVQVTTTDLTGDKVELLEYYDQLSEREQGIIIGEAKTMAHNNAESKNAETA